MCAYTSSRGRGGRGGASLLRRRQHNKKSNDNGRNATSRVPDFPVIARHAADGSQHNTSAAADNTNKAQQQQQQQQQQQPRTSRVATVLTADATELPRKLNTKVFIDGLPYQYNPAPGKPSLEDELVAFATAWKVGKALRLIKKSGQGFGFLVFRSPHSVEAAVRVLNGRKFLGRPLRVEAAKPRDAHSDDTDAAGGNSSSSNHNDAAADGRAATAHHHRVSPGQRDGVASYQRQVLVSDLGKAAQPEILREVLRDVAPQLEAKLEAIKLTSRNRKAFLTFASPDDVPAAVQFLDGLQMLGRRIAAVRAAPPGTLPYSRTPTHAMTTATTAAAVHTPAVATASGNNDNEEATTAEAPLIVPLGVVATTAATKTASASSGSASARSRRAAAAEQQQQVQQQQPTARQPSNVTGKTSKYNLLDDGPAEVYVGNLSEAVTEAMLRAHFASCGTLRTCELLVHRDTHQPMGIARLVFALPAYAAYAQATMHGSRLHGCVLRVDRGDVASPPLACDDATAASADTAAAAAAHDGVDDDEEETAFLRLYGVRDKATLLRRAAGDVSDDDDDEEEHFHDVDVDTTAQPPASSSSSARGGARVRTSRKTATAAAATTTATNAKKAATTKAKKTAKGVSGKKRTKRA